MNKYIKNNENRQTARELYFNVFYIFEHHNSWIINYKTINENGELIFGQKQYKATFNIGHEVNIKNMEEIEILPDFAYWTANAPETKSTIKKVMKNGTRLI